MNTPFAANGSNTSLIPFTPLSTSALPFAAATGATTIDSQLSSSSPVSASVPVTRPSVRRLGSPGFLVADLLSAAASGCNDVAAPASRRQSPSIFSRVDELAQSDSAENAAVSSLKQHQRQQSSPLSLITSFSPVPLLSSSASTHHASPASVANDANVGRYTTDRDGSSASVVADALTPEKTLSADYSSTPAASASKPRRGSRRPRHTSTGPTTKFAVGEFASPSTLAPAAADAAVAAQLTPPLTKSQQQQQQEPVAVFLQAAGNQQPAAASCSSHSQAMSQTPTIAGVQRQSTSAASAPLNQSALQVIASPSVELIHNGYGIKNPLLQARPPVASVGCVENSATNGDGILDSLGECKSLFMSALRNSII